MSLKDEPIFQSVQTMNIAVIGSIFTVIAMALVFFVFAKGSYESQAREHVKKVQENTNYQISQVLENIENNTLLWTLIDSTWKSPDKSRAFVKKLADAQKLPRCKGKPCEGDDARLNTVITTNANERSIKVGWAKYSFKVIYDAKDKFVTIDASDLLGKNSVPVVEEEVVSEEAE